MRLLLRGLHRDRRADPWPTIPVPSDRLQGMMEKRPPAIRCSASLFPRDGEVEITGSKDSKQRFSVRSRRQARPTGLVCPVKLDIARFASRSLLGYREIIELKTGTLSAPLRFPRGSQKQAQQPGRRHEMCCSGIDELWKKLPLTHPLAGKGKRRDSSRSHFPPPLILKRPKLG